MGTLHEYQHTFVVISRLALLRMRNLSDESYRGNQNAHFVFSNFFFFNLAVYKTVWENTVQADRPQMTVWLMRIACWKPKAT
jgi:hypothetical protein